MSKILCILMAVLAMGAVIDCKVGVEEGTNQHNICSIISCVNEQHNIRNKRANGRAVEILGGVESLVTGIIKTTFEGVGRNQKQQGEERVIIGGGSYNDNTVYLDDSDYE